MDRFQRTRGLIGDHGLDILKNTKVAIFGIGGVGSYVFEGLVRAGIGGLMIVDKDIVDISNINRQLVALDSTVGLPKVDVAYERGLQINPNVRIDKRQVFLLPDTRGEIDISDCDYIIDAIDNVTAKIMLIEMAKEHNIPSITCLGTGNKLDASKFIITDIENTSVCPLAKVMRKELKQRNISGVKVLYSTEKPLVNCRPPLSISFVPSVAGLLIAGEVVRDLLKSSERRE